MTLTEPADQREGAGAEAGVPPDDTADSTDIPVETIEDEVLVEEISIDGMCGVY